MLNTGADEDSHEDNITTQQVIDYIGTIRKSNIGNECILIIRYF